jgi:hypothetical protein
VQVIGCFFRSRQRPILLVSPAIAAHDEDADMILGGELVLLAIEEIVVPIEHSGFVIELRGRSIDPRSPKL